MANDNSDKAKKGKNDELYTQYADIQKEMDAYLGYNPDVFRGKTVLLPCDDPEWSNFTRFFARNFEQFGLKKLISTSYAAGSKGMETWKPTPFETESPAYDSGKSRTRGKMFILERDTDNDGKIGIDDLEWSYLEGDGDFRSDEVCKLRDEADIIITNPPFSLFREFLAWVLAGGKRKFSIIGNMNSVTCRENFHFIMNNEVWYGPSISSGEREFGVPEDYPMDTAGCREDEDDNRYIRLKGIRWFTNIDHARRHQPLTLMTMQENILRSKHKDVRGREYRRYDNYYAIEVPYSDAIPSDYEGEMGVPISFLDKHCPQQFDIIGLDRYVEDNTMPSRRMHIKGKEMYDRIIIRKKQ